MNYTLPPLPEWTKMDNLNGLVPSEIRQALQAYAIAAIEMNRVPDGWQVVPKEPTIEMVYAACGADRTLDIYERNDVKKHRVYKAMLAAAPQQP